MLVIDDGLVRTRELTRAEVNDAMSVLWVAAAEAIVESMAEVTDPVAEAARRRSRRHQKTVDIPRIDGTHKRHTRRTGGSRRPAVQRGCIRRRDRIAVEEGQSKVTKTDRDNSQRLIGNPVMNALQISS